MIEGYKVTHHAAGAAGLCGAMVIRGRYEAMRAPTPSLAEGSPVSERVRIGEEEVRGRT